MADSEQMLAFCIGSANADQVDVRLAQLSARAQSAALMEKPLAMFHRESGSDWPTAPIVYRCKTEAYTSLQRCLDRARRLWGAQRLRLGNNMPAEGELDWGEFGSISWRLPQTADEQTANDASAGNSAKAQNAKDCPQKQNAAKHSAETATSPDSCAPPAHLHKTTETAETVETADTAKTAPRPAAAMRTDDPASLDGESLDIILNCIARQTGYSRDEIRLDFDWQLDLAIDSLKLAAILSELWEMFGLANPENIDTSSYPTVGHLVAYLQTVRKSSPAETSAAPELDGIASTPKNLDIHNEAAASSNAESNEASNKEPDVKPVGEIGVCRTERVQPLLDQIAAILKVPAASLRLRPRAGWHHLREKDAEAKWVITDAAHPLRGYPVYTDQNDSFKALGEPYTEPLEVMAWLKYRMDERENAWYYAVGALMAKFLDSVTVAQPSALGPKIFLSNHQTALEGYIFPLLAPIVTGLSLQGVSMLDHGIAWADTVSDFMFSHAYFPRHLLGKKRGFVFGDTMGLLRLLPGLESDMATRRWGLHIVASGQREWIARQRLTEVSALWLEMAIRLNIPLVPVRFSRGLPLEDPGQPQDFPYGMGRQDIAFGPEIAPQALAGLSAKTRKMRVLQALNDFSIDSETPSDPDPAFAAEWQDWLQYYGGDPIATLLFCCMRRFVPVNAELAAQTTEFPNALLAFLTALQGQRLWQTSLELILPDNPDGRWVATLTRMVAPDARLQVSLRPGEDARIIMR